MSTALAKRKLPTIQDLVKDENNIRAVSTDLIVYLNQEPPKSWIAQHPFIKKEIVNADGQKVRVPYEYLPINKVEYLLKKIFVHFKIEVMKTGMLLNSVECTVRVHYVDPITGTWMFHDGVGAQEIQTAKDTGSLKLDMSNINKSAIQMALPIAKTIAIKDACDAFGKLFGSDLNRNNAVDYSTLLSESIDPGELLELYNLKKESLGADDILNAERIINNKEIRNYQKLYNQLQAI